MGFRSILALAFLAPSILAQEDQWVRKITPELQQQIENFVQNIALPQSQNQGCVLGFMNEGNTFYTSGFGLADISNGIPNTNDTQFGLGSISKSFTALVAVRVLREHFPERGEGILDTPIVQLVPELNIVLRDRQRTEHVTFRDMLTHRVCLVQDFFSTTAEAVSTIEEVVYRSRYIEAACDLRQGPVYGNQMFTLAGYVAAKIAGKTFEELARQMLDDLGMYNSSLVHESDPVDATFRALPYYHVGPEMVLYNPEMLKKIIPQNPAGGLFSTSNDMMRYLTFLMNRGALDGQQVVPPEVVDWVLRPAIIWGGGVFKNNEGDKPMMEYAYSLGWGAAIYDGWQVIEHGGSYLAYSGIASIMPALKLVIYSGTHESRDRNWMFGVHIFIAELLKGNPNAEEAALKVINQMMTQSSNEITFFDDNPFSSKNLPNQGILKEFKASWTNLERKVFAGPVVGVYGAGLYGDLNITEQLNEATNTMEYYMQWGKWYKGFLTEDPRYPGDLFEISMETDALQDFPAYGMPHDLKAFVGFHPDTEVPTASVIIANSDLNWVAGVATFVIGATLDNLPVIPYEPNSC